MKKILIISVILLTCFCQFCYADDEWISYKNFNKIILEKKVVSQADITLVGLFIKTGNKKSNFFQTINIPLKLYDTPITFNLNTNKNEEKTHINSLAISGKINLSSTKTASKHWLYIEIPELTSEINYHINSDTFTGNASTEAYIKSNFLFTTGIAPKELTLYSDRLMQRTFDFTYKCKNINNQTINTEEILSVTVFAALNSVTYTDGTSWSLESLVIPQNVSTAYTQEKDNNISGNNENPTKPQTISDQQETNSETTAKPAKPDEKTNSINASNSLTSEAQNESNDDSKKLYFIASLIFIAACIWIIVRAKKLNNAETNTIHQNMELKQELEQESTTQNQSTEEINPSVEEKEPIKEEKTIIEEQPHEEVETEKPTIPIEQTTDSSKEDLSNKIKFCPNCGEKIFEGAAFCATCGTKIE